MRGARSGEAGRGGDCGRVVAAWADDAAAWLGNSGEVARAPRCTGLTTSGARRFLTSLRGSWETLRQRGDGGGGKQRRRRGLGFRRGAAQARVAETARVGELQGRRDLK
jgi:hypothetical protein